MSIKDKYRVLPIERSDYKEWLLYKHYAHRLPSIIIHSYGLFGKENVLLGVCIFGLAGNKNLNKINNYNVLELLRLVVNEHLPKNTLSYFVSKCLKLLPKPRIIISYADGNQGHHGYIYQATNWIYTGLSASAQVYCNDYEELHSKTFSDKFGSRSIDVAKKNGYKIKNKLGKHRYFKLIGNKVERNKMKTELLCKYDVQPYPKGDNTTYDANYEPDLQPILF
jgi:hypothetical protein